MALARRRTQARPRIRIVAVLLVALVLAAACGGDDQDTARRSPSTEAPPPAPAVAPLTGLPQPDEALRNRPALLVKVDNTGKAQGQQAGINAADLVYVEKVEGGATRLAVVFQSTDADVGPVRSARTTDVELTANLGRPLFAYSGGNTGVVARIRGANLIDAGTDASPGAYQSRGSGVLRFFVPTGALYGLAPPDSTPPPQLLTYRAPEDPVTAQGVEDTRGVRISYGDQVNTQVSYEPAPEGWVRTQDGRPHVDAGGGRVAPANVVVQFVDYRPSGFADVVGTPSPEAVLVGEGEAWFLTGGKLVRGRWSRPDPGAPTAYVDAAGQPVAFAPGRTWVELAPLGSAAPL